MWEIRELDGEGNEFQHVDDVRRKVDVPPVQAAGHETQNVAQARFLPVGKLGEGVPDGKDAKKLEKSYPKFMYTQESVHEFFFLKGA